MHSFWKTPTTSNVIRDTVSSKNCRRKPSMLYDTSY